VNNPLHLPNATSHWCESWGREQEKWRRLFNYIPALAAFHPLVSKPFTKQTSNATSASKCPVAKQWHESVEDTGNNPVCDSILRRSY